MPWPNFFVCILVYMTNSAAGGVRQQAKIESSRTIPKIVRERMRQDPLIAIIPMIQSFWVLILAALLPFSWPTREAASWLKHMHAPVDGGTAFSSGG